MSTERRWEVSLHAMHHLIEYKAVTIQPFYEALLLHENKHFPGTLLSFLHFYVNFWEIFQWCPILLFLCHIHLLKSIVVFFFAAVLMKGHTEKRVLSSWMTRKNDSLSVFCWGLLSTPNGCQKFWFYFSALTKESELKLTVTLAIGGNYLCL